MPINRTRLFARSVLIGLAVLGVYFGALYAIAPSVTSPIFIAGVLAAPTIIIGNYIAGKHAALDYVGAEPFEDELAQKMNAELAEEMDVPEPDLMIGRMDSPNAFAVGRKGNGVIVLSVTLVEHLEPDEIRAVIAHELSHLKSHDTVVMTMGNSIPLLIEEATYGLTRNRTGLLDTTVAAILHAIGTAMKTVMMLPLRAISRSREYVADIDSAHFTGEPYALSSALVKINNYHQAAGTSGPPEEVNELCIFSADRKIVDRMLGTHPPIDDRIQRLNQMPPDGPSDD